MTDVTVNVTEDDENIGHALIVFLHSLPPLSNPRVGIARIAASDMPWLGAKGWQAAPAALPVELVSQSPQATVLRAGPEICAPIRIDDKVRVGIEGAGVSGRVFWPAITQDYLPVPIPRSGRIPHR